MSHKNIFDLPTSAEDAPIREGDAVVIIRPDGEIVPMTVGVDQTKVDAIRGKDPHDMTEDELDLALQGQTLFLLTMAAKSEAIMDFLTKLASMPGETDLDKMKRAAAIN